MTHLSSELRVALVVRSKTIWHWQLQLIQSLCESSLIDIQSVVVVEGEMVEIPYLVKKFHQLDAAVFSTPMPAFDEVDIDVLATNYPYAQWVRARDRDSIAALNADILINLSEQPLSAALQSLPTLGTLETYFSSQGELRSDDFAIAEYLAGGKQVSVAVVLQDPKQNTYVLADMQPSLEGGSISRNLSQYWRWIAYLWQRSCQSILQHGKHIKQVSSRRLEPTSGTACTTITPLQSIQLYQRLLMHMGAKLKQKYLDKEQWVLLVKHSSKHSSKHASIDPLAPDFSSFHELVPPADCFWADPFVFSHKGRDYVFFEALPFATEKGHLCAMELFSDGHHSEPVVIIQEAHHLSYPNVFEYQSEHYLIPESGDHGTVDLYRCTQFPYQWQYEKTLMQDIHAYDATLLEYQGRWWLFASVAPKLGLSACETLQVFFADSPVSDHWQAHPSNPIISDASTARPGGQFFVKDEQLYRVSQDCAGQYGAGININQVTTLNETSYSEQLIRCHYPEWDQRLIALHTFNFNANLAVADALRVTTKRLL